jgi:hypothetical protein
MTNQINSNLGSRILRSVAEVRGTATIRETSAGATQPKQSVAESIPADCKVVKLGRQQPSRAARPDEQERSAKHQLHLRVDELTLAFIEQLMVRLEAERLPEVIRTALREYEWVWHEFGGRLELSNNLGSFPVPICDDDAQRFEGTDRSSQEPSKAKSKRLNIVLADAPMQRLDRLLRMTGAASRADVVRVALCVLDARLAEFETAVGSGRVQSVISAPYE